MNKHRFALWVVLILAIVYGLPSVLGPLLLDNVAVYLRISAFISGGLLLAGSWLLLRGNYASVFVFGLSASIYAFTILIPAFLNHGGAALSMLMGAFYFSLFLRIGLALAAHFVVRWRHC